MLRPADGITDRRCFVRTRCPNECVSDLVEKRRRDAANLFDHLRCVTREMSFEFLENTLGILQSEIPFGIAQSFALVSPAFHLVCRLLLEKTKEITVCVIFSVAVL